MSETTAQSSHPTFPCPVCEQPVPVGAAVCPNPNCKVNLSALATLDALPASLYRAALAQIQAHRDTEALQTLDSALAYAPNLAEGWAVRGELLVRLGRKAEAEESFQRALQIQPDLAGAAASLAALQGGEAAHRRRVTSLRIGLMVLVAALALTAGLLMRPKPAVQTTGVPLPPERPIATAYAAQPALAGIRAEETSGGIVLSGTVADETTRQWAISLAGALYGGKIDASSLTIAPTATPILPSPTAPPPDLAGAVIAVLQQLPGWESAQLTVTQEMGGIRLGGTAPSARFIQEAVLAAGGVTGVGWVDAQSVSIDTGALQALVTAALQADPHTMEMNITVEQMESGVRLFGKVPRPEYVEAAGAISRTVPGVEWVDVSGLEVVWQGREHVVSPTDTLISISQKYYGVWWMWTVIYDANRDQIRDPRLIQDGIILIIPDASNNMDQPPN